MINPFQAAIDLFQWACRKDDRYVIEVMKMNKHLFTEGFIKWIHSNLHVFSAFCDRAKAVVSSGRTHYSARTIIETVRYHTDIKQKNGKSFKIDNDMVPYLSRLCELVYPETNGLFEKRITHKTIRESATKAAFNCDSL